MAYSKEEREILLEFGQRVRGAREARGWSQERLAAEAGMDRTYIGGIERGARNPALLNINKLADTLGESAVGFRPCHRPVRRPKPVRGR